MTAGNYSLWFHDVQIGTATFEAAAPDGISPGVLRPTAAYWGVRPELQTLTLGLAALHHEPVEQIHAFFRKSLEDIAAGRLELRDTTDTKVPTSLLFVGDYGPSELEPDMRATLMILLRAIFDNPLDRGERSDAYAN